MLTSYISCVLRLCVASLLVWLSCAGAGVGAGGVVDGVGGDLLSGAVAFSGGGLSFLALGLQLVLNGLYETCLGLMEVSRKCSHAMHREAQVP